MAGESKMRLDCAYGIAGLIKSHACQADISTTKCPLWPCNLKYETFRFRPILCRSAMRPNVGHLSSLESFPKAACREHQPRWQLRTLATTPCDRRAVPPESGRRFSTRDRCKCAHLLRPPWSAAPRHCITNATITGRYPR